MTFKSGSSFFKFFFFFLLKVTDSELNSRKYSTQIDLLLAKLKNTATEKH